MERSLLRAYSLGIVLEDKEGESDMIKVSPIEQLSLFKGELSQQKLNYDVKLPDAQGIKREEHIEGGSEIIAKWIFSSGNRITAPNVKKNESVLIYKFADTDEFYWEIFMREPSLRRLEHVNYSFSNLPNGVNPYDKNSSYWFEISTREKYIHLHTAKNNNELFEYDIKIDTANGNIIITDDIDNNFTLDSKNKVITINHTSGHKIELNSSSVIMNESGGASITLNGGDITISCNNLNFNTGNTVITGGDIQLNGSTVTANGEDLNIDLT